MKRALACLATTMGLLGIVTSVRASCPANELVCWRETRETSAPTDSLQCGATYLHYDLRIGQVTSNTWSDTEFPTESRMGVSDAFEVVGPPAGTPVTLTALLHTRAYVEAHCTLWGGRALARTTLRSSDRADSVEVAITNPYCPYDFGVGNSANPALAVEIPAIVGELFDLRIEITTSGHNGYTQVRGDLEFDGLRPGMGIVSCQGYVVAATPVRGSSWGALKLRYR